ncbi:putative reverse transcriptase domain-containing protein [Tanacetum coccineum]
MTPESVQAMIDQDLQRKFTNGDGSHSSHGDNRRNVQTARPCFYADFMKCQPLNFKGTEGVVGLTQWIEMMELVFNINGCAIENHCNLLGAALTWWNSQIRTLGPEAYSMTWEVLKKKMTDKYCPQGEIKKLEIELWNLKVKSNDVPTYTECFQELTLICTKFVANETEKVDKYISGLPDNIYGNVKSARPKTLDETIELANDLMDQKLRTYAERQTDNKRKADDASRNNHGHQQQPFKRQNVAKVYNIGSGEKKPYGGSLPKCTKCHFHHNGPCTQKCHKCNKVGHFARDCRSSGNTNVANTQKGNEENPKGNGCFECGTTRHFKRDCPKLKNKDGEMGVHKAGYTQLEMRRRMGIHQRTRTQMSLRISAKKEEINLILGVALVARAPYRLAPSGNEGIVRTTTRAFPLPSLARFIRPSSSPWGVPILFFKKKDGSFRMCIDYQYDSKGHSKTAVYSKLWFMVLRDSVIADSLTNAPADKKEHEEHLKAILELLKKEKLYAKFSKCEFWIPKVQFLGHVIDSRGLAGYYRRFIEGSSKIAKSTMKLTQKGITFDCLRHILDQKELNMRQRRWLELQSDYDCDIRYHPRKENVVADALSPQIKALKPENLEKEDVGGMIRKDIPKEKLKPRADRTLCLNAEVCYLAIWRLKIRDYARIPHDHKFLSRVPTDVQDMKKAILAGPI